MAFTSAYEELIERVVDCLVKGDFDTLVRHRHLSQDAVAAFQREISEYPGTLCMPPADALAKVQLEEYDPGLDHDFWATVPMWYDGEESDQCIELDFFETDQGHIQVELYDILVP